MLARCARDKLLLSNAKLRTSTVQSPRSPGIEFGDCGPLYLCHLPSFLIGTIVPGDYMPDGARSCTAGLARHIRQERSSLSSAERTDPGGSCLQVGDRSDLHGRQ